jgi:hypothetical protein
MVGLGLAVAGVGGTPARLTAAGECLPLVQYHAGNTTCYLPQHVTAAERELSVRPIRPVRAVRDALHLPLSQVLVLAGTGRGRPGHAVAITYVFGSPDSSCIARGSCGRSSGYVIVQETVGLRAVSGLNVTERSGTFPGPWHLEANIPQTRLSLEITSNSSKQAVLRIGKRILQAARDR